MRFICEIAGAEYVLEADTPESAAHMAAREYRNTADSRGQIRYTVTVAEANEADLPLIAGEDYRVDIDIEDEP